MDTRGSAGVAYALAAYTSWGLLPAYWRELRELPALEVLLVRVLGTAVFAALLLTLSRRWPELRTAIASRRTIAALAASALLISLNWLLFIWAVAQDQIVATSLGYYLNPLMNVVLGIALLGERLRPLQFVAVALASVGVAYFAWSLGELPWISLALAVSFALYGLIRKTVAVESLAGLAIETGLLAPIAAVVVAQQEFAGIGPVTQAATQGRWVATLLLGAGIVTALPLIWFASAARRLRLATVGLFQYIAPTLALALAVLVYGEPFTSAHLVAFGCIWTALVLYSIELLRARG
jgi:chloramphenicol-sensitive protein RarD